MTVDQQMLYIIIVNFINVSLLFYQPFYLMNYRWKNKKLGFCLIVLICFSFFFCMYILLPKAVILRTGLNLSLYLLLNGLFFLDRPGKKLLVSAEILILLVLAEFFTHRLFALMGFNGIREMSFNEISMGELLIVNRTYFVFNMFVIIMWKKIIQKQWIRGALTYMLVPVYEIILFSAFLSRLERFDMFTAFLGIGLLMLGLTIDIIMMYLMKQMQQNIETEERLSELYRQRQYEAEYYQESQKHVEEMKEIRHDFINQIQSVQLLLREGTAAEEAGALLDAAYKKMAETRLVSYCSNPVLNALISMKSEKAIKNGITFDVSCGPEEIKGAEDIDLCSLLGNMLDNALEACMRIPETEPRRIVLRMLQKGGFLVIRTENTAAITLKEGHFPHTSKTDHMNHGYGLKLIDRICRKYGGELKTEIMDNQVIVIAYLAIDMT